MLLSHIDVSLSLSLPLSLKSIHMSLDEELKIQINTILCQINNSVNTMRTEGLGNPVSFPSSGLKEVPTWLLLFILNNLHGSAKTEV